MKDKLTYNKLEDRLRELEKQNVELRQSEQFHLANEERFSKMLNHSPLAFQSLDSEGRIIMVNNAWLNIFRLKREEVIGKRFVDFIASKNHHSCQNQFNLLKTEGEIHCEVNIKYKNDEPRVISLDGRSNHSKNQEIYRSHFILQDVTEKKLAEVNLKESEERLKNLNRLTSEMLALDKLESIYKFITESLQKLYSDSIIIYVSIDKENNKARFETYSGLDGSLLNKIIKISGFNPVGREYNLLKEHSQIFRTGKLFEFKGGLDEFADTEFPSFAAKAIEKLIGLNKIYTIDITKDDNLLAAIHFFTFNKKTITDNGFIEAFVRQAGLVLQEKMAEEALRKSEANLKAIIENSIESIWSIDTDYRIQYVNDVFSKAFEASFGILLKKGDSIMEALPDYLKSMWKERYDRAFNGEQFIFLDKVDAGETPIYIEVAMNPIFVDGKVTGASFYGKDISEQKNYETQLIAAKEKAEESDRLKSAFLANMSHEIRTPMNGILGFADLLKTPEITSDEQLEYVKNIEQGGDRMLNIINDIISISKIESGQMELKIKELNINKELENIYSFFKIEVEKKGIQFSYQNALPIDDASLNTDGEKVYAVLSNLIKNAIKFSREGSIEFGYKIKNEFLEFFVKDQGIGIPKHRHDAIFERFIQAEIEDKNAYQGAGLGLSISKAYVEMLGGSIWVESEVDKGSTFYFTLPYQSRKLNVNENNKMKASITNSDALANLKVLIVEDDDLSEKLIAMHIRKLGSTTISVTTGTEAVERCRSNPDIDLILMDIQLPGINGYLATQQIREFNKDVIIIAQTAYALQGDREKALAAGCNAYISKPIKVDLLKQMIKELVK